MTEALPAVVSGVAFAHASEAELARILEFYEVRWAYEPHTFPILWNLDGAVVESFSPDFFLPDLDLYVELTTLKQSLVRKKNRKLRRLRELYPDIRIKLFYGRDFRALMLKFGKLALIDELSGTSGQVVPERPAPVPAAALADPITLPTVPLAPLEPVAAETAPIGAPVAIAVDPDPVRAELAARRRARRRRRRRPGRPAEAVAPPH